MDLSRVLNVYNTYYFQYIINMYYYMCIVLYLHLY